MQKKFTTKIIIIIFIVLLAPLTSYTIFQFAERDKDEALIQSIYTQQLNSILFSVNQYCWDVFNSWVSEIQSICKICKSMTNYSAGIQAVHELMNNTPSIAGIYIQKKQDEGFLVFKDSGAGNRPNIKKEKNNSFFAE